jgi:hypothetical protein
LVKVPTGKTDPVQSPLQVGEVPWRTQLSFYVNGRPIKVQDAFDRW